MKMPEYNEWSLFGMQLQLFALCALEDLRRSGFAVRRRGLSAEIRITVGKRSHWEPLEAFSEHDRQFFGRRNVAISRLKKC